MPAPTFAEALTEAVRHFEQHGYENREELELWLARLRAAAEREMPGDSETRRQMRESMAAIYQRLIERGRIVDYVPGVSRYTLDKVRPHLRAELDRRILASVDLIKLNRKAAVEKTLQRFSGWSTSIPRGGSGVIDKREVKSGIGKSLKQIKFEARRVAIDQGHKLVANIANIVAVENGAIAAVWHSHYRQAGYDARPCHKARDDKFFAIRGNWAIEKGYMTKGAGYTDEIEMVGMLPFCRCYYSYISSLRALPPEMLTKKGQEELARAKAKAAELMA